MIVNRRETIIIKFIEVAKAKGERILRFLGSIKLREGSEHLMAGRIWLILIGALLIGWVLTWALSGWASPRLNTMATVSIAFGISVLCILTYILAKYIRDLAQVTKSQSEAAKMQLEIIIKQAKASIDLSERTGETTQYYQEQLKRMLRPLLAIHLEKEKVNKWEKWEGTFSIRNIGNGPAMQPLIRVKAQIVTHSAHKEDDKVLFEKKLLALGNLDNAVPMVIPLMIPVSIRSLVTQQPVRLTYLLEMYWQSMYEDGYAKATVPLHLVVDRGGNAKLHMNKIDIDWDATLDVVSDENGGSV